MNKLAVFFSSLALAGVIWFFAASDPVIQIKDDFRPKSDWLEDFSIPHGKILYVVVDRDGVYLGTEKFDLAGAKVGINALLTEYKIRNLEFYGTDLARYGDVIELYTSVDPKLIRWSSFPTRPVPTGTRMPLTGFLKRRCCFAEDVENHRHGDE